MSAKFHFDGPDRIIFDDVELEEQVSAIIHNLVETLNAKVPELESLFDNRVKVTVLLKLAENTLLVNNII